MRKQSGPQRKKPRDKGQSGKKDVRSRRAFLLRCDSRVFQRLTAWAADEGRSSRAQAERVLESWLPWAVEHEWRPKRSNTVSLVVRMPAELVRVLKKVARQSEMSASEYAEHLVWKAIHAYEGHRALPTGLARQRRRVGRGV